MRICIQSVTATSLFVDYYTTRRASRYFTSPPTKSPLIFLKCKCIKILKRHPLNALLDDVQGEGVAVQIYGKY